jgi:cellobiose-specific phosphotransferase system component IIA
MIGENMSNRTEALEALEVVYPSVLDTLPDEFDSHQFFLALAHQYQQLYVQALATFADTEHPFMNVHGQIARRLSDSGLVHDTQKDVVSEDIFRQKNEARLWRKK